MYKFIKRFKHEKKKNNDKLLGMAITMFISFSILNIFLIYNFINILNTI